MREIDQHTGTVDYSETTENPRPNEPDNAPFQNTPYVEPQTGDLPDPPTSPAERPVPPEIPPGEAKAPGEAEDEALKRDREQLGERREVSAAGAREGEKLSDKKENPVNQDRDSDRRTTPGGLEHDKDGGAKTDANKTDREKGAPPKGPGRPPNKR